MGLVIGIRVWIQFGMLWIVGAYGPGAEMAMGDTHLHLRKFLNKTEKWKKTLGTQWIFKKIF